MKILITGICGFVGSSLAKGWLESHPEDTLIGLDNLIRPGSETNRADLTRRGVKIYHGDIRVASDFESLPNVDWVIDAAANPSVLAGIDGKSSSRQVMEHNLSGTLNLLEFCKCSKAGFILLSTSRVYSIPPLASLPVKTMKEALEPDFKQLNLPGFGPEGVSESFSTAPPLSLYGSSKAASELLAQEYGFTFGFPVWINRCGVLAGAGQFGHAQQGIFSFWLHAWKAQKALKYIGFGGSGHQVRDALHPLDLIPVLEQQMQATQMEADGIYNLAGGRENARSLAQLSTWCEARWGKHRVDAVKEERAFDIPWMVLDSSKAKSRWNFKVNRTMEDILNEIAEFAETHPDWLETSGANL